MELIGTMDKHWKKIIAREGIIAVVCAWTGVVLIVPSLIGMILIEARSPQLSFLFATGCLFLFPVYVCVLIFRLIFEFFDWANATLRESQS